MQVKRAIVSAFGAVLAAALLGGCGGSAPSGSVVPASGTNALAQWQRDGTAHAACPSARPGEARCMALILNKSVQRNISGWTPADLQARYNLPSSSKGSGQIVAIVDAYDNPNVSSDLAKYRAQFNLGTATFSKYNQDGQIGNYPAGSYSWGLEEDLDAEMVSASCPNCTIYLIEANSSSTTDLEAAEDEAVKLGAHIVTNSWGCPGSLCVSASHFDKKGVEYLASNGDGGYGVQAPAAFDSVAAIGGTVLSKSGSQYSETLWSGSGGGCASGVPKPKWQHDSFCSGRAIGDASAVAWNVAEYDSYNYGGWFTVGGTSVSSPLLAGVFGLAGNAAKQRGGRTFWQSKHHKYLYDVCGSSCIYQTYSYAGGWGSPDGIGAF